MWDILHIFFKNQLVTALLCICLAVTLFLSGELSKQYNHVSVRFIEPTISTEQYIKWKESSIEAQKETETQIETLSVWNPPQSCQLTSEKTGNSCLSEVILCEGNSQNIYPMKFSYGHELFASDDAGCIIDEQTAMELFGSIQAVGLRIRKEEESYQVRGIIHTKKPMVIFHNKDNTASYQNLEIRLTGDNSSDTIQQFLTTEGFDAPMGIINGIVIGKLLRSLCVLPIYIYLLIQWYFVLSSFSKWLPALILIVFTGLAVFFLPTPIYIPSDWVPPAWSDFSFFVQKWRNFQESMSVLTISRLMPADYTLLTRLLLQMAFLLVQICMLLKVEPSRF